MRCAVIPVRRIAEVPHCNRRLNQRRNLKLTSQRHASIPKAFDFVFKFYREAVIMLDGEVTSCCDSLASVCLWGAASPGECATRQLLAGGGGFCIRSSNMHLLRQLSGPSPEVFAALHRTPASRCRLRPICFRCVQLLTSLLRRHSAAAWLSLLLCLPWFYPFLTQLLLPACLMQLLKRDFLTSEVETALLSP